MGELSKRIGETGEDIVNEFLKMIGWGSVVKNFDIPSVNSKKSGKTTHGIDGYYHYESPLIAGTVENVIISTKYSSKKYPQYPVSKFKEYLIDIGSAIESFKKSELRSNTINGYSGIKGSFDRGVIFWINNTDDGYDDVLEKLLRIQMPDQYNHDGILLVDNKKMDFFYKSIEFVRNKFQNNEIDFTYFSTGLNSDSITVKNGKVLPIQYLSSGLIPFRVQSKENEKTLIICSQESFEKDALLKIIGLTKNLTLDFQSKIVIAFPDYNRLNHEQTIEEVKLNFNEASLTNNLSILNFNNSYRN